MLRELLAWLPLCALAFTCWAGCPGASNPQTDDTGANDDLDRHFDAAFDYLADGAMDSAMPSRCANAGAALTFVGGVPKHAVQGTVFSLTPYQKDVASSYKPRPITVKLAASGKPLSYCPVLWSLSSSGGWIFPSSARTNANGEASAWWVAGSNASPTLQIKSGVATLALTGSVSAGPATRTNSLHLRYQAPQAVEFRSRITPLTAPTNTFYAVMTWSGGYAGIQFVSAPTKGSSRVSCGGHHASSCTQCPYDSRGNYHGGAWCNGECQWKNNRCQAKPFAETMVIFSTWDRPQKGKATVVDKGRANKTVQFGGEGTGVSSRLMLPPSAHGAIAGLPASYTLKANGEYEIHARFSYPADCNCTEVSLSFRDIKNQLGPIALGKHRYAEKPVSGQFGAFVEDWAEAPGDTCLNAGTRAAVFHTVQYRTPSGAWRVIKQSVFAPNFVPSNHEICANYSYRATSKGFHISSGGNAVDAPLLNGTKSLQLP